MTDNRIAIRSRYVLESFPRVGLARDESLEAVIEIERLQASLDYWRAVAEDALNATKILALAFIEAA